MEDNGSNKDFYAIISLVLIEKNSTRINHTQIRKVDKIWDHR